jgi:hypothetical protein
LSRLAIIYADDEAIAIRAAGDFALLCPRDQKLAEAADGVFDAGDRWTLASAAVDFEAQGVAVGHVVTLSKEGTFRGPEDLAVAAVSGGSVTLRRKGHDAGVGQPPGPVAGVAGVRFAVATLAPQAERASYDLNRRYGIDDLIAGRRTAELYDPRDVADVCVLTVLWTQYLAMARHAGEMADDFAAKSRAFKADLDEMLARVSVRWTPVSGPSRNTGSFTTRISR